VNIRIIFLILLFCSQIASAEPTDPVRKTALKGTVTLSFDDGPSPEYTPQILAILKKNHIHANFFMVGTNAEKYPDLVREVLAEGHTIGSHSLTHPMLTKISEAQLHREVDVTEAILQKIAGIHATCLRYPFGASNEHVRAYIRSQNITPLPMGWNSFDYERPGVQKIISQVLNNAHSGQVFLFHDGFPGANRSQTVAALQPIIDGIRAKGLGFSTICN
jgi:peptidoglycan/xylan/chitin deacetylase (PgdA/CDA1 family)